MSYCRLVFICWNRPLSENDLWRLDKTLKAEYLHSQWQLCSTFKDEQKETKYSMFWRTLKCFKRSLLVTIVLDAIVLGLDFVGPQILK